jgi:L-galactose dehydrogenase
MNYRALGRTGLQVSELSFGCAPLGNEYGGLDDAEASKSVWAALDLGVNCFDTSPYYGRTLSERRLGAALEGRRSEVIVATKGGRFDYALENGFDFSRQGILRMCEESLLRLRTDYLDIYQLHDIEFGERRQVLEEGVAALHELKAAGKARFIGVTGFPPGLLRDVAAAVELDLVLSYCHYNLLNRRMATELVPLVRERGMGLMNASVLHMGILTQAGPQAWHPAPARVKEAGRRAAAWCGERGYALSDVGMQFAVANPDVSTTLMGARTAEEVRRTVEVAGQPLDAMALAGIEEILAPVLNVEWRSGRPENYDPLAEPPDPSAQAGAALG